MQPEQEKPRCHDPLCNVCKGGEAENLADAFRTGDISRVSVPEPTGGEADWPEEVYVSRTLGGWRCSLEPVVHGMRRYIPAPEVQAGEGWTVIVCKVCGAQMSKYDHGYLGCKCKGWGDDPTDDNYGIFTEERHEIVPVVRTAQPQAGEDDRERLKRRLKEDQEVLRRLADQQPSEEEP